MIDSSLFKRGTQREDHMTRTKTLKPLRTTEEAWNLALENRGLLYRYLHRFVNRSRLEWYSQDALEQELESYAWEGFYNACLYWDPNKGTLATYSYPAITNFLVRAIIKLGRMGGNYIGMKKGSGVFLNSIEGEDDWHRMINGGAQDPLREEASGIADSLPQPWMASTEDNSFEDQVIDSIEHERLVKALMATIPKMGEPYVTMVKLKFSDPPKTLQEVADATGYSRAWVAEKLTEAFEFLGHQLAAQGFSNPWKESDDPSDG
jgi:hypothetical protein